MERERLTARNSLQIAALGVLVSALVSLIVIFAMRFMMRGRAEPATEQHPADTLPSWTGPQAVPTIPPAGGQAVQPAVDIVMPVEVPQHFTEDIVIPGFTETGQDVELQDDTSGRSPEGV